MVSSEFLYTTLLSCGLTAPNQTSQYHISSGDLSSHILERVDIPSHSRPSTPVDIPLLDFESSPAAKSSSGLPPPASPYAPLDKGLPSQASSFGPSLDPPDSGEVDDGADDCDIGNGDQVVRDAVRPVYTFLRLRR